MVDRRRDERRAFERPSAERRRGRPQKPDARRVTLVFRLTDESNKKLRAIAKLNGQTPREFVEEAVAEAIGDCSDEDIFARAS